MLGIADDGRVRVLTLNRPEALNAFNEALYDATVEALRDAALDPSVAVVVLTGTGRAFSTGTDVAELAARTADRASVRPGTYGFTGLIDELSMFGKPLLCAVNGMALGVGVTLLGYADLVFMADEARLRCPFTDLAVAPEAASSYLFPLLMGRQHASWLLMSSDWFSAADCERMGLAFRVTPAADLLPETMRYAHRLAGKPLASLVETKRTIVGAHRDHIAAARRRETTAYERLLGSPANAEAFAAVQQRRAPDFVAVDRAHAPDLAHHRAD